MVIKLTQQYVNNCLKVPYGMGHIEITDEDTTGLYIDVAAKSAGVGAYYFRKRINKQLRRFPLGSTTSISLAEARSKVLTLRDQIAKGMYAAGSPNVAQVKEPTLDAFFYGKYLAAIKARNRTWEDSVKRYELRLKPRFGHLALSAITRADLEDLHLGLKAQGLAGATADHFLQLAKTILAKAVDAELIEVNVASKISLFREDNKVQRFLSPQELKRLVTVLRAKKGCVVCQVALFLLATGARLNEALSATWGQFNLEGRVWQIPAANSKSKRMRAVPLNDSAMEILAQLQLVRLDSEDREEHLFVSTRTGQPVKFVHKTWQNLKKEAGIENLRIHDLRHSHASLLAAQGQSLLMIQSILGHQQPSTTMRYAHLSQASLLTASNAASRAIEEAMREEV
jgi:integrase